MHHNARVCVVVGANGEKRDRHVEDGGGEGNAQLSALLSATEHEEPEDDQERELLAFACWTLDKVAKSYLRACWKLRLAMLGELRVDHGVLKCEPSYECVADLKQKQDERRPATCVVSPKDLETHCGHGRGPK